jgi:hypothetical protein
LAKLPQISVIKTKKPTEKNEDFKIHSLETPFSKPDFFQNQKSPFFAQFSKKIQKK